MIKTQLELSWRAWPFVPMSHSPRVTSGLACLLPVGFLIIFYFFFSDLLIKLKSLAKSQVCGRRSHCRD